jgi:hypothetical protein
MVRATLVELPSPLMSDLNGHKVLGIPFESALHHGIG